MPDILPNTTVKELGGIIIARLPDATIGPTIIDLWYLFCCICGAKTDPSIPVFAIDEPRSRRYKARVTILRTLSLPGSLPTHLSIASNAFIARLELKRNSPIKTNKGTGLNDIAASES